MSTGQVLYKNAANGKPGREPNRAQLSLENCWSTLDSSVLFDKKWSLKTYKIVKIEKLAIRYF